MDATLPSRPQNCGDARADLYRRRVGRHRVKNQIGPNDQGSGVKIARDFSPWLRPVHAEKFPIGCLVGGAGGGTWKILLPRSPWSILSSLKEAVGAGGLHHDVGIFS